MDELVISLTRIEARLIHVQSQLDRVLNQPKSDIISPGEAMLYTGCRSFSAQYRWFVRYGIKPYAKGKYLRRDITNKVGTLSLHQPKTETHQ